MLLNGPEPTSKVVVEIFELTRDEQDSVAGGPEVENDPGHD